MLLGHGPSKLNPFWSPWPVTIESIASDNISSRCSIRAIIPLSATAPRISSLFQKQRPPFGLLMVKWSRVGTELMNCNPVLVLPSRISYQQVLQHRARCSNFFWALTASCILLFHSSALPALHPVTSSRGFEAIAKTARSACWWLYWPHIIFVWSFWPKRCGKQMRHIFLSADMKSFRLLIGRGVSPRHHKPLLLQNARQNVPMEWKSTLSCR